MYTSLIKKINLIGNLVDLSRRSFTYEDRLYKYAVRGFGVGVPGLSIQNVDWQKIEGKVHKFSLIASLSS